MKPWHLEGLFSGGEYEYLRSTVSGYFLVSKITPPAMASSFPSIHTCMYVMYVCEASCVSWVCGVPEKNF